MALSTFVGELPVAWDRDQRVVDPGIIRSADVYHHGLTGAMVACYMVRGRWSDTALQALHSAFAVALPERHSSRITNYAEARIAVYLGVWPPYETTSNDLPPLEHADDLRAVLACSAWVMDQSLAALGRGHPRGVDRPDSLPAPATDVLARFCLADEALGDQWVPDGFPHHREWGASGQSYGKRPPSISEGTCKPGEVSRPMRARRGLRRRGAHPALGRTASCRATTTVWGAGSGASPVGRDSAGPRRRPAQRLGRSSPAPIVRRRLRAGHVMSSHVGR